MKFKTSFTLILLASLLAALLGLVRVPSAHAQSNITDCTDDTQLRSVITNATSGETITFGCSGTIPITVANGPLVIGTTLTLDGSGQSVTLDGQNQVEILQVYGGVIFTLNALTIAHGSASGGFDGGGLYNNGSVSISNSTFAYNSDVSGIFGGGGLFSQSGTVNISNSTFYNNSASQGGGLFSLSSTVNISNSTFANNSATFGGGLRNDGGTVSISNSTFANNSASQGGGGGGLSTQSNGTLSIAQSIAADNRGGNCQGTISSQGYNLESATDCGFTRTGDLQNTDPKLDPNGLQNNGGPTQTIALQQGSPAIDHVPAGLCPKTDQRGVSRPDDAEASCDIGAYESAFVDNDLGLSGLPAPITTDATSSQGAVVTYTPPTVVDEDSPGPSVTCTPASGSTFPIGTTTVTCTVSDSDDTNSPVSGSFQVVVKDVTPPTLSLPANITMDATSPQGRTVTYTVTASDPDNPPSQLTISCSPASGSTFPIGTTTVNCTASDPAGNTASGNFTVTVKGAADQVNELINTVNSMGLASNLQNALDAKLQDVLTAINAGQTATACSELTDFIGFVQSHTGKGISSIQAQTLIQAAQQIQAVLAC